MTASIPDHHVVVIGSGVGGLCAGVRLKQAGIEDFVIIDRAADLGGYLAGQCIPGNRGGYPVGDLPVLLLP